MSAVIIAAANLLPALRERAAGEGDLITFSDTEPIQALQAIIEQRPSLIILERLFAATPRGAALINRIKTDPQLAHAEIRVMSHSGDYMRQITRPARAAAAATPAGEPPAPAAVVAEAPATSPLDWHGTRRAARYRIRPGVEILVDGNPARVVDLSTIGAQVVSATILRPNQRVRVSVEADESVLRFRGSIAWASFELPRPTEPPQYRAGIEFFDANAGALERFCERHRA